MLAQWCRAALTGNFCRFDGRASLSDAAAPAALRFAALSIFDPSAVASIS
jgi:xanthine dehydrogenase iron-sulfur cluster and FAD-binding subunit A